MDKLKSSFINMVISLTLVACAAGIALAYMNEVTKGPKAEARRLKKIKAIESVMPNITNDPMKDHSTFLAVNGEDSLDFYVGKVDSIPSSVAISTYTMKGFSGLIKLMVGLDKEGTIQNIAVLEQKETPGLGTKIKEPKFIAQYVGKNPSKNNIEVDKDGGEIDALTGATITTRAFSEAVQRAYDTYVENKDKIIPTLEPNLEQSEIK